MVNETALWFGLGTRSTWLGLGNDRCHLVEFKYKYMVTFQKISVMFDTQDVISNLLGESDVCDPPLKPALCPSWDFHTL